MRRLTFLVALGAAAAVVAGCEQAPPPAAAATALPVVTVAPPLARPIVDWDGYVGQFEAVERVDLRPRVSGYLVEVHFVDGDFVEKGQPMFTIDPRPFEAALDQARGREAAAVARVENARAELERAKGLVGIGAVSQEELEALEAAARAAEAELAGSRGAVRSESLNLEFTRVVAPISGRVSDRRVDVGNAVRADETVLTTIVSVDPMHFVFQGSEAQLLKYKRANAAAGRDVRIRLQDENDYAWRGKLEFMDNAMDRSAGTIRGRAIVQNPDGFLTPGMFGHMQLQASETYTGILLPDSAIATRGADRLVFVVDENGIVSARIIELGPLHEGLRVIRTGLAPTDRVVVDGQQRARPGQPVEAQLAAIQAPGPNGERFAIVPAEAADSRTAAAGAH